VNVERLLAADGDHDVEPLVPEHGLEDGRLVGLVFHEENPARMASMTS
jgi:hypothetical protein